MEFPKVTISREEFDEKVEEQDKRTMRKFIFISFLIGFFLSLIFFQFSPLQFTDLKDYFVKAMLSFLVFTASGFMLTFCWFFLLKEENSTKEICKRYKYWI